MRSTSHRTTSDRICSFNRLYAEPPGYWRTSGLLAELARTPDDTLVWYDSVSGKPLFVAPRGRSLEAFLRESEVHGWPSFRNEEVVWAHVRVMGSEVVSTAGTHLGHNIPDEAGDRYCVNLVAVAGLPRE